MLSYLSARDHHVLDFKKTCIATSQHALHYKPLLYMYVLIFLMFFFRTRSPSGGFRIERKCTATTCPVYNMSCIQPSYMQQHLLYTHLLHVRSPCGGFRKERKRKATSEESDRQENLPNTPLLQFFHNLHLCCNLHVCCNTFSDFCFCEKSRCGGCRTERNCIQTPRAVHIPDV